MSTPGLIFKLGGLRLTGYGLIVALGLAAGYIMSCWQANCRRIRTNALNKSFLYSLLGALVLGRVLYIISNWGFYGEYKGAILRLWEGGMSTMGAFAGGIIGVILGTGKRGFRQALDTLMPGMMLALAISRIGELTCWQGCGVIVSDGPGFPITIANSQGTRCLAICIYEAVFALVAMWRAMSRQMKPAGYASLSSAMLLGLIQVPLESMRSDDFLAIGFVKIDQLTAMLMALTIIVMFLRGHLRAHHNRTAGFVALGIALAMVAMCVVEEFKIDGSANPALNYSMLCVYITIMAFCGLYLCMGWRESYSSNTRRKSGSDKTPYFAERGRSDTYEAKSKSVSYTNMPRRSSAQTSPTPRYSSRVDAYRQSQATRRSR